MTHEVTFCDNLHFRIYHEKQCGNGHKEYEKKITTILET